MDRNEYAARKAELADGLMVEFLAAVEAGTPDHRAPVYGGDIPGHAGATLKESLTEDETLALFKALLRSTDTAVRLQASAIVTRIAAEHADLHAEHLVMEEIEAADEAFDEAAREDELAEAHAGYAASRGLSSGLLSSSYRR